MDITKIIIAALSAVTTILALTGAITTEESTTLATTGTAAATGLAGFIAAIVSIVKAHKGNGIADETGKHGKIDMSDTL